MPDEKEKPFLIEFSTANSIIDMISETLVMELDWEWEAFKSCMEFLSKNTENNETRSKIWCLVRTERELSRIKGSDGSFSDAPDTGKTDTDPAREIAVDIPALILIRQNGSAEIGWRGCPFWWPVLIAPKKMRPVIFASKLVDIE